MSVAMTTIAIANGSRRFEAVAVVDGLGRVAADLEAERRVDTAHLADDALGDRSVRRAVRRHLDRGKAGARDVADLGAADAVERLDVADEARDRRGVAVDGRNRPHRFLGHAGEPLVDRLGDLPRLGRLRERAHVEVVEAGVEERRREQEQHERHEHDDEARAPADEAGQAGEEAFVRRLGRHAEAVTEPAEQRREERERGDHAREHDRDARDPERAHRRVLEHEQARQRGGDGARGEHDRAAAARHGAADRVGNVEPGAALLAEAAHHQQAVVDAEPDAQHHHDVQRVERDVGDGRHCTQRDHRREDAAERERERQARGDDAAEHDRHDNDRDRQRDQLGALRILLGAVGELAVDEQLAADEDLGRVDAAQCRRDGRHRVVLGAVTQVRLQLDTHTDRFAVRTRAVLHGRDAGRCFELGDGRVRDLCTLDDRDDRTTVRIELVEPVADLFRFERRRAVEVRVERREQCARRHDAEGRDDDPREQNETRAGATRWK